VSNIYLLKDVAKISGQSIHTVKYYLKIGLIKEIGRTPDTNFRFFDNSTIENLHKIRDLRLQNITLKEIGNIINKEQGT